MGDHVPQQGKRRRGLAFRNKGSLSRVGSVSLATQPTNARASALMVGVGGFEPPTSWSQSRLYKRRRPLASFPAKIYHSKAIEVNRFGVAGIK